MTSCILKPLENKKILITRAQDQQSEARKLFEAQGAIVVDFPALIIGPPINSNLLDEAIKNIEKYDWIVFSSTNGVNSIENKLNLIGKSLSNITNLKIAAVGKKTSARLKQIGASVDFVPPEFVSDSLMKHFPIINLRGAKLLLPRVQSGGRNILNKSFLDLGAYVDEIPAYESFCPKEMPREAVDSILANDVNAIVFTSGKTVSNSVQLLSKTIGKSWQDSFTDIRIISIGPQTSLNCIKYFGKVDAEADPHDLDGVLNACINILKNVS
tara:strand:+ start:4287 stop:5096 length:810 start_codon:yes stop_codon:yes gene_type:complete